MVFAVQSRWAEGILSRFSCLGYGKNHWSVSGGQQPYWLCLGWRICPDVRKFDKRVKVYSHRSPLPLWICLGCWRQL